MFGEGTIAFGNTVISGDMLIAERDAHLSPTLMNMLTCLASHRNTYVHSDRLHSLLYADREDGGPDPKALGIYAYRIRRALAKVGSDAVLQAANRRGYKLVAGDRDSVFTIRFTKQQYVALDKLLRHAQPNHPALASMVSSAARDALVVESAH